MAEWFLVLPDKIAKYRRAAMINEPSCLRSKYDDDWDIKRRQNKQKKRKKNVKNKNTI